MMDTYLINEPNVDKWLDHLKAMLDGSKDIDLNKLGGAGPYIKNIFLHTEDANLSKSIKYFFKAYNHLLHHYNNTAYEANADEILLMLNIANSFREKEHVKEYEKRLYDANLENTGSLHYFNQLSSLVSNFVEQAEANNLIDNQAVLYEYLLYLKKCYLHVFTDNDLNQSLLPTIKKILKAAVGVNEKLSSLSGFLLYSLDEKEEEIADDPAITKSIIQYCIASKNITNQLLNHLILDFAQAHKTTFNHILDSFNCSLSSDGFTIVYADQSYKELVLQNHLTRSIETNN